MHDKYNIKCHDISATIKKNTFHADKVGPNCFMQTYKSCRLINFNSIFGVISLEFNNPVWQLDYTFSARYPPSGNDDQVINGKRIKILSDNLINQANDSFFNGYISSRQVRYQPDPYDRFKYYCAVAYYSQDDFDACRKKYLVPGG